jgi:uncharacterized protein
LPSSPARRRASAQGKRLVLVARRKERLDALAAELGNTRVVAADLSQPGAPAGLMADIANHDETVELLVNNAGFGLAGRFAELDEARQREMINLNCGALTELAHAVLPGMIDRNSGGILNVASTAAFQPGPGMTVYFASKAFVLSFSEALHDEVKRHGVRVSCLCPGPTRTEFRSVSGFDPKGRLGKISADSQSVVRAGLRGLEHNRAVVVPGVANKIIAQVHRVFPRAVMRRAARMR